MSTPASPTFKDLFSSQSSDYARFRPHYPDALFRYLSSLPPGHMLAWDCGTGNGQAAIALAERFDRVIATDPSDKQLAQATAHPRVEYRRASAEDSGLGAGVVDLVTVAQAFHWFRQQEFFEEVKRVTRPGGVLAIWSYSLARISPEVDALVLRLYRDTLGEYWEKERRLVEEGYRGVAVPFDEIDPPAFAMTAEWSLEELLGYLGTWSALQTFIQRNGTNPLESLAPELARAWGPAGRRAVSWDLALRVFRVG